MSDELKQEALAYHAAEPAGKLQILPTKPMATQRDLSLAYSPGVAYACEEIAAIRRRRRSIPGGRTSSR